MQAKARMASVVSSTLPALRRLIRSVRRCYSHSIIYNLQGRVTHPATQEQSRFSTFINSQDQASPCEELDRAAAAANGNGIWEAQILAHYPRRLGETANAIGWLVGSLGFHSSRGLGRPIPWGGSLDVAP